MLRTSATLAFIAVMALARAADTTTDEPPDVFGELPTPTSTADSTIQDQVSSTEPPESTSTEPNTTTDTPVPSETSSTPPKTHTINVGASGHKYTPETLEANVGDTLKFRFYPGDHWVIRGDFNDPCIPYEYVGTDRTGFSSGMQHVDDINNPPTWSIRVNDTDPIFYYCAAPGSCVPNHMMGIINPTPNQTLADWRGKAEEADFQLRPGEPFPTETDPSAGGNDDKGSSLSGGEIAGVVVGSLAILAIAALMFFWCGRRGGFKAAYHKHIRGSSYQDHHEAGAPPMAHAPGGGPQSNYTPSEYGQGYHSPAGQMTAYSQSPPPMSPEHPARFAYSPDHMAGSYYDHRVHSQQPSIAPYPPYIEVPKPEPRNDPIELPTSHDPGNSPLPDYQDDGDRPKFSWMGATETPYRPAKT